MTWQYCWPLRLDLHWSKGSICRLTSLGRWDDGGEQQRQTVIQIDTDTLPISTYIQVYCCKQVVSTVSILYLHFMCNGNAINFFSIRIYLCFSQVICCYLLFLLSKLVRYLWREIVSHRQNVKWNISITLKHWTTNEPSMDYVAY